MFRMLSILGMALVASTSYGQMVVEPPKYVTQQVEAHWECIDYSDIQCELIGYGADCAAALADADHQLNACQYLCEGGGVAEKVFSVCEDEEGEGESGMFLAGPCQQQAGWRVKIRYQFGNGELISFRATACTYCQAVQKTWKTALALGCSKCGVCCGMRKCTIEKRPCCGCCATSCSVTPYHGCSCVSPKRARRRRKCR